MIQSSTNTQSIAYLLYTTSVLVSGLHRLHRLLVPCSRFALRRLGIRIGFLIAIRSFAYLLHAIIIHRPAQVPAGPLFPIYLRPSSWAKRRTTNLERHLTLPHLTLFQSSLRLAARLRILETPKFRSNPISPVIKHSFSGGHITGF